MNETLPTPPSQRPPNSPAVLLTLAALVIGAGAGYMIASGPQRKAGYDAGYADGTAAGVAQIKKQLESTVDLGKDPVLKEISGIVRSVGSDTLTIETNVRSANPLASPVPTLRTIKVTASTKTFTEVGKKPEDFDKEMQAYQKSLDESLKAGTTAATNAPVPPQLPSQSTDEAIALDKITVGSNVIVTAENDIFRAASFDASSVRVVNAAPADQGTPKLASPPAPSHPPDPNVAPIVPPQPQTEPPKPLFAPPPKP